MYINALYKIKSWCIKPKDKDIVYISNSICSIGTIAIIINNSIVWTKTT